MNMIEAALEAFESREWFRPVSAKGQGYAYTWRDPDPHDVDRNDIIRVPSFSGGHTKMARFPFFVQLFGEWEVVDPFTVNNGG